MIAHITDSNFESEVLASKGLVLVDFWAPWCGPCKMLAPVLESLDKEIGDKVAIKNLNTDENRIYPERYDIMGIPTMMIFILSVPPLVARGRFSRSDRQGAHRYTLRP